MAEAMMPRLFIQAGPHQGLELELRRGSNWIGRESSNDLTIDDPTVSSHHCEIVVTELEVRIRDLNSSNGTFIDGEPVREADLRQGQVLRVGQVELLLDLPSAYIAIPELAPADVLRAATLEDGTPACLHHPQVAAAFHCARCGHTFCEQCVHRLRLIKGRHHILCPECSGECAVLDAEEDRGDSIARKVWKNLRFIFGRRSKPGRRR
jgi:hypothetical protein